MRLRHQTTLLAVGATHFARAEECDLTRYVNTDMGTVTGGNTFPGVSHPFGMVKIGPDLFTGTDSYSGYAPNGNFSGFSLLHESGTGGAPKYGVVTQLPRLGDADSFNPLAKPDDGRAKSDKGEVGYYRCEMSSGITVEMAATERAGMLRYEFPERGKGSVVVDVSHVLPSFRGMGLGQHYLGGEIEVEEKERMMKYWGKGTYDNGWNRSPPWTVYFCGSFDAPGTFKTFLGRDSKGEELHHYSACPSVQSANRLGAVFTFDASKVTSRVGVSFISTEQACSNVDSQIPEDTTLEELTAATKEVWNEKVLGKIRTTDANESRLKLLYSSLYHWALLPTNKTGENPKWKSDEPYYDDIFTLWDTFRSATPLLHVLQPKVYSEFIRSLIDTYRHEGYMPDGRSSFANGATQGGSNADNVLADAFIKGVRGPVNWMDGFAAMVRNAEVVPPNNDDPRDRSGSTREGRGALKDWLEYGFITPKYGRAVSRAVEYAVNDYALSVVAAGLSHPSASKYLARSRQWTNHFNPHARVGRFSGFLVPREAPNSSSGTKPKFLPQDPLDCGGCYWADAYYQALPWEYTLNAHHEIATLIHLCGGPASFLDRLETTFAAGMGGLVPNAAKNKTIFNPGNEPSFATPYLFNFLGRQDLTARTVRSIVDKYYSDAPDGLPGNSDAGALESWEIWALLGLYPLTGQTTYLVGSPMFVGDVDVDVGEGVLRIRTSVEGRPVSESASEGVEAIYVQSLRVNGKPWTKSWVTHDDIFARGGTLEFVMGYEPVDWAAAGPLPPSPASEGYEPGREAGPGHVEGERRAKRKEDA